MAPALSRSAYHRIMFTLVYIVGSTDSSENALVVSTSAGQWCRRWKMLGHQPEKAARKAIVKHIVRATGAAQYGFCPSKLFAKAKRFGNVIIGPEVETPFIAVSIAASVSRWVSYG